MEYNLISNVESCHIQLPALLYYSHWPSIIITLFFGIFVYFKSGRSLLGKILLLISFSFSLWAILNLIVWTTFDSQTYSFFWSFFEILSVLFYFLVLYFGYVFIEEKDIPFGAKVIFAVFFLPVVLISSSKYYLAGFDAASCDAIMNDKFLYYVYALRGAVFLGTLILLITKYIKYRKDEIKKNKIVVVGVGLVLLLLSFLVTQYAGDLISSDYYEMEFYGLFAIDIFVGFLVYLIVKYEAFNIRLIGAQALVVALVILIGSQFAFIQNPINMVLTGITLAIAVGFGWMLIRSVKMEVQRKEELQVMTNRLAQANDQLRKLDNAKSEFISIASHQLRTPLTAIKGFISLLLEGSYGKISPMLKEVLNKIYISNERLIDLVEDMLNLSRIESGRMEYDIKKVNMEEVLKEICDTFLIRSKEKGLKLELKLPENPLPEVSTDRNKIREVISNLVDNAIKYTLKGWVTVKLSQNEDKVRIAVIDTGIGVPKEEMPYLFEKFSRGKDINRLNTGGTGLGLHVGKKMIESLSGTLWVESEGAGKGSTFFVEVPMEIKEAK